ncbi:gluconokinase [Puia dinghuensis]|uniref:Gluconate kinase n=1 Tax=Puia dinghuensis TaxID=1792502 RepID=A0A8J2UAN4_9BACT|nr:gluconokinase [Puia dinghuensis]GGA90899.1 gluconate kinase [Puia dinghuensis]
MKSIVIGIDIGTTNTKAVAFASTGEVLASAGASYPVYTDAGGRHELDPDQLLGAVTAVLKEVYGKVGKAVAGISFSCAMHSLIAVDRDGRSLTRAITWADTRSERYARDLKGSEAGSRIYAVTGTPIHAMSPLCKLLWMKAEQPEIFGRAARFISIKEYIWWHLFGEYRVDHSLASATGLFDIRRRVWNAESLELAGIDADRLSEPVAGTYWEAGLCHGWESLGLPADLPFVIGGSDGCLANLGSGAVHPGDTALTIGTSGAIRMTTPEPEPDPQERIFSYILSEDHYVCGGATNNGGNVLQWYARQVLGRNDADASEFGRLVAEAEAIAPGADGLVFLPYLLGERAPVWDANARGVFFGLRSIHGERHFLRAVLEGVSFSLRQIGASLEETIGDVRHIYASGGFTHSTLWLQMIADIFQKKVSVTASADASAIGAAQMGFYALGIIPALGDATGSLVKVVSTYEPDGGRGQVYQKNYAVYTELYRRLKDLM